MIDKMTKLTLLLAYLLVLCLVLAQLLNGHQVEMKIFKNRCGQNKYYNGSIPFEVLSVSSKLECATFCLGNRSCNSFNVRSEYGEKVCELFHQRPECEELEQQIGSATYMNDEIRCPEGHLPSENGCICPRGMHGIRCNMRYRDCASYASQGITDPDHQILYIWPDAYPEPFEVKCFLSYGGLTYLQENKGGPSCDSNAPIDFFNRDWLSYKNGFGNLNCKFWLGLEKIHALTAQKNYQLTVDIESKGIGSPHPYMQGYYGNFTVGTEAQGYLVNMTWFANKPTLPIGDSLVSTGNATESIKGQKFSTFDQDNDNSVSNCAAEFQAGFWFNDCAAANPNGWMVLTPDGTRNTSVPSILWKHDWGHRAISYVALKLEG